MERTWCATCDKKITEGGDFAWICALHARADFDKSNTRSLFKVQEVSRSISMPLFRLPLLFLLVLGRGVSEVTLLFVFLLEALFIVNISRRESPSIKAALRKPDDCEKPGVHLDQVTIHANIYLRIG